jgi:predicted nucleic acid-binding protein
VALASRLGTRLVTADTKLLKAFPKFARPLPAA